MLRETADKIGRDLGNLLDLVDVIRRMGEGVAESIETERAAAHGQRPLPGLVEDGEEIAGVVGLEARIRELEGDLQKSCEETAEMANRAQGMIAERDDARAEIVRLNEVCADTVAEREEAEERAQSLRTALFQVRDSGRLAGAKAIASRALEEDGKARDVAAEKARRTSPSASPRKAGSGQAAD